MRRHHAPAAGGHGGCHRTARADRGRPLLSEGDGLGAVTGLADDFDVSVSLQDHPEPGAKQCLIVG